MNTLHSLSKRRSFVSLWLLFFLLSTFVSVCDAETVDKSLGIDQHLNHSYLEDTNEDANNIEFSHLDKTGEYCCDALSAQANKFPVTLHAPSVPDIGHVLTTFSLVPAPSLYRSPDWRSVSSGTVRLAVYLITRRLRI